MNIGYFMAFLLIEAVWGIIWYAFAVRRMLNQWPKQKDWKNKLAWLLQFSLVTAFGLGTAWMIYVKMILEN